MTEGNEFDSDVPDVNDGFFSGIPQAKIINMRKFKSFKEARDFCKEEVDKTDIYHIFKRNDRVVLLWHNGQTYCTRCVVEHNNIFCKH